MKISLKIFEIFDLKIFGRPIPKCSNFFHNKPFWSRFFSKLCRFSWRTWWNRSPARAMLLVASKTFCPPLKFLPPSRYATDISGYRIEPANHMGSQATTRDFVEAPCHGLAESSRIGLYFLVFAHGTFCELSLTLTGPRPVLAGGKDCL